MLFEIIFPHGPMLMQTKIGKEINKIIQFLHKKLSGDKVMLLPKFGSNPLYDFQESGFDGQMSDGRPRHGSSSAVQWHDEEEEVYKMAFLCHFEAEIRALIH